MPSRADPFSCPGCGQTFYPGEAKAPPRIVRALRAIRRWWRDSRVEPGDPPKPDPLPPVPLLASRAELEARTRALFGRYRPELWR